MEPMLYSLLKGVIALFVVVDPFGNVPIFISLTSHKERRDRTRIFNTAIIVGFIVLTTLTILGERVLAVMGITIYSFMVAGGILLIIISIRILIHGGWNEEHTKGEDIGAVPIAFPLLVGPGAITTSIMTLRSYGLTIALLSIIVALTVVWVTLRFIDTIHRLLGRTGSNVVSRVMAVLVAAIGIQFILEGLRMYGAYL